MNKYKCTFVNCGNVYAGLVEAIDFYNAFSMVGSGVNCRDSDGNLTYCYQQDLVKIELILNVDVEGCY